MPRITYHILQRTNPKIVSTHCPVLQYYRLVSPTLHMLYQLSIVHSSRKSSVGARQLIKHYSEQLLHKGRHCGRPDKIFLLRDGQLSTEAVRLAVQSLSHRRSICVASQRHKKLLTFKSILFNKSYVFLVLGIQILNETGRTEH